MTRNIRHAVSFVLSAAAVFCLFLTPAVSSSASAYYYYEDPLLLRNYCSNSMAGFRIDPWMINELRSVKSCGSQKLSTEPMEYFIARHFVERDGWFADRDTSYDKLITEDLTDFFLAVDWVARGIAEYGENNQGAIICVDNSTANYLTSNYSFLYGLYRNVNFGLDVYRDKLWDGWSVVVIYVELCG